MSEPVTLDWNAVTKSHPTVGTPNVNVTVLTYEVVGEIEREGQNPEVLVFSARRCRATSPSSCSPRPSRASRMAK